MKIDVKKVAELANLKLTKEEEEKFEKQLSSILDYVKKLDEVDTSNIEPTSQITGLENITREDKTKPSLSQEQVLSNAKLKQNDMFKVKGILEE